MILLEAFLRGIIVIAIAGVLSVILRNRSAALRHHIWATAIVVQLALLAFIPVMPRITLPVLPTIDAFVVEEPAAPSQTETPTGTESSLSQSSGAEVPAARTATPRTKPLPWRKIVLITWAIGAVLILIRYLVGTLIMARIARSGERVDDGKWLSLAQRTARDVGITRPVTLLWGDKLAVPVTWGVLYPMILLPQSAHEWPAERRRFVLVHEMAHVKRFDALTQLISQVALALFWFSPMMWIADWRMRVEREHACDDTVLQHGTEPTLYADELLQMVRGLVSRRTARPAFAALAMARRSEFEGRMLAILDPERARSTAGIGSGAAFALLSLLIAAPLSAVDPFAFNVTTHVVPADAVPARSPARTAGIAPLDLVGDTLYHCQALDLNQVISLTHTRTDDDPNLSYVEVKAARDGRCMVGALLGPVKVREDGRGVELLSPTARIRVQELTQNDHRAVELIRNVTGTIERVFRRNNNVVPANNVVSADEEWLARMLREIVVDADESLKDSRNTRSWSVEKPPVAKTSKEVIARLEQIWKDMSSENDAREAMTAQLPTADRPMLFAIMRVVSQFDSGLEARTLLIAAAPQYLTVKDKKLEDAWFAATMTLLSSYERKKALLTAVTLVPTHPHLRAGILKSVAGMASDRDKTEVLTALATIS